MDNTQTGGVAVPQDKGVSAAMYRSTARSSAPSACRARCRARRRRGQGRCRPARGEV